MKIGSIFSALLENELKVHLVRLLRLTSTCKNLRKQWDTKEIYKLMTIYFLFSFF